MTKQFEEECEEPKDFILGRLFSDLPEVWSYPWEVFSNQLEEEDEQDMGSTVIRPFRQHYP